MNKTKDFIFEWLKFMDAADQSDMQTFNLNYQGTQGLLAIYYGVGPKFSQKQILEIVNIRNKSLGKTELHNLKVQTTRFLGYLISLELLNKTKDEIDKRVSHYHVTDKAMKLIHDIEKHFDKS